MLKHTLLFSILVGSTLAESYLPKVVYGTPSSMQVTLLEEEIDAIRKLPVYRIDFTVQTEDGGDDDSIVHRFVEYEHKTSYKC